MEYNSEEKQHADLIREINLPGNIRFDPEKLSLLGFYSDELSVYRARKIWKETLKNCFLLEAGHDFSFSLSSSLEASSYCLSCYFESSCARYAFWRLTNYQAPEAQYLIETAHIPQSESRHNDFMGASDLKPLQGNTQEPQILDTSFSLSSREVHSKVKTKIMAMLKTLRQIFL